MDAINYFYEDTDFILAHQDIYNEWITQAILNEGYKLIGINYIFCSDDHLLQINKEYLNHDFYTDIITFNNSESKEEIESDIFISIDRTKENAMTNQTEHSLELSRIMIHGVLHLLGYDDKSDEQRNTMRQKENAYLSLLKI